ncbi:MAG: hypothetical protein R8G01_16855 [Ilumatobacteraceae bacterium]|nr:hypothetical protein [Ilumatobacteraceae bacterium]
MELLYPLALLACPVGMGLMMWFMMRGSKSDSAETPGRDQEINSLRAEIAALRQRSDSTPPASQTTH